MSIKLEFSIAMRYLRSKRKDSFISVVSFFSFVGILLGVATLIVVMSVMQGFHVELIRNILGIQGHISIHQKDNSGIANYQEIIAIAKNIPDVKFAAPLTLGEGLVVSSNKNSQGVLIRGINPIDLLDKPIIKQEVEIDALNKFALGEGVLIGNVLANRLSATIGDTIKIFIPEKSSTILGMIPRSKSYKVAGIFDVGLYQYNSTTIFMQIDDANRLFNTLNPTEIELILENPDNASSIKLHLNHALHNQYLINDWQHFNDSFLNSLEVERIVMFTILMLIIIVAAFNIISSLVMLVKDKTKNIAILRTIGMSRNSVVRIFIISGSTIGLLGTIFGTVLGVMISLYMERIRAGLESVFGIKLFDPVIYYLSKLPSVLDWSSVVLVVALSLAFSILATIYPAYRAARLMPHEVLRYE